jgi:hypothetical protein
VPFFGADLATLTSKKPTLNYTNLENADPKRVLNLLTLHLGGMVTRYGPWRWFRTFLTMERVMMSFGGVLGTLTLSLARIGGVVFAQLAEAQRLMAQLAPTVTALSQSAVDGGRWKRTEKKLTKMTLSFSTADYTPLGPLLKFADNVQASCRDSVGRPAGQSHGDGPRAQHDRAR